MKEYEDTQIWNANIVPIWGFTTKIILFSFGKNNMYEITYDEKNANMF